MKAFPDYEELNRDFYTNKDAPMLGKRGFGNYSINTRNIRIENISYFKDSIINIIDNKKGSLSPKDIREIHQVDGINDKELQFIEYSYQIDIINNTIEEIKPNTYAKKFQYDNEWYVKIPNKITRLKYILERYEQKIKKFIIKKENKQKLLMLVFKDNTIKLYNHIYDNDMYKHHLQGTIDSNNIEQIKNISIITVEKAIELELKLDFDTKIIEKLPLII